MTRSCSDLGGRKYGEKYSDKIVIVKPSVRNLIASPEELFNSILGLKFFHAGSLHLGSFEDKPNILHFHPCEHPLHFLDQTKTLQVEWLRNAKTIVTCTNPFCNLMLGTRYTVEELSNMMFHLLLKQVVPDLPTANYLDCSSANCVAMDAEEAAEIHKLGMVPVLANSFFGTINNGYFDETLNTFDFGLTLDPLIIRLYDLGRVIEWLRFLVIKGWQRQKELIAQNSIDLLGPKPAK